jgi:hypothetical protein
VILEIALPIDVDGTGKVSHVVKEDILVALDEEKVLFPEMIRDPRGADQYFGVGVVAVGAHADRFRRKGSVGQTRTSAAPQLTKKRAPNFFGARISSGRKLKDRLLLLLEKGKAGALVLGDLVTGGQRVERTLLGLSTEIIEGHFLTAAEFLKAMVEEVGFSAFLADDAECHGVFSFRMLGVVV